ncbi:MAG: tRNA preQ1(34) S-adenosylmethionine ribosyltransferase-isomerase QueA [Opitutaceae bacterium]
MKTDLFDYPLPDALIAQHPAARRDESRLLVVDRKTREIHHHVFRDLPGFLHPGDLIIRNTARVLPARIHAEKTSGGAVECLLLNPTEDGRDWWALLRPGRRLKPGARFGRSGVFLAEVLSKSPTGECLIRFLENRHSTVPALAEAVGVMPLPPYVNRSTPTPADSAEDRERYQTVYARRDRPVAAAAPTAGLHFTPEVDRTLRENGVETGEIILHVGLGTFRPIETDDVESHPMHAETYEIPAETRFQLAVERSGRTLAVGTTSLRALEDFARTTDCRSGPAILRRTDIFIHPPAGFQIVQGLLTNFHLPRSTLLCLIAAFLTPESTEGIGWFKEIYRIAAEKKYRFLSYGDAMLIL